MHPYRHFSHCWQCRRRIFERYLPEVNRRGLVGRRAQLALFKKIHVELLAQVATDDTPECLPLQPASQQSTNSTQGERDLWSAVIELSIHDLASRFDAGAARAWFCSADTGVGSFLWACESVGLDHEAARDKISKLRPADIRHRDARIANNGRRPGRQKVRDTDLHGAIPRLFVKTKHETGLSEGPPAKIRFPFLLSLSTERLQDGVEFDDADSVNHFPGPP